jgi:hypothetical protein
MGGPREAPSVPTRTRPHRSLPALLVVVALIAAAGPISAARPQTEALRLTPDRERAGSSEIQATGGNDRGPALRNELVPPRPRTAQAVVPTDRPAAGLTRSAWTARPSVDIPTPKPKTARVGEPEPSVGGGPGAFSGRNRVWIPALGIARSLHFYPCTAKSYPGDVVYRWGCAGRNNVYLFGHAHSVFKPLHDAYVRGRLQKGMQVHYANGDGRVSTYKVIWWKVTTPDKGGFAFAAQSKPSMTLQTCVGAKSEYRLIVRLAKVG